MKSLLYILSLLFSLSLFADGKTKKSSASDKKNSCSQTLKAPPKEEMTVVIKPELMFLRTALAHHVQKREFSIPDTQAAIINFIGEIDPAALMITDSEYQHLSQLSEKTLKNIHQHVFETPGRHFFYQLMSEVADRYAQLIRKFSSEKDYRDQVFERAHFYQQEAERGKNKVDFSVRPDDGRGIETKFIDLIAVSMLKYLSQSHQQKVGLSSLTEREAYVMAIREVRGQLRNILRIILSAHHLPHLIAKSYIVTLDPHSDLHLPQETRSLMRDMAGEMVGLGIQMAPDVRGLKVTHVVPGGSAETSKIMPGDVITHVTSKEIKNYLKSKKTASHQWLQFRNIPLEDVSHYLSGKEGSKVTLRVRREDKTFEVTVPRQRLSMAQSRIQIKIVKSPNGPIAHVHFDSFYNGVADQLRDELQKVLDKNQIAGVALDIRRNGGGSVNELSPILGLFVPQGPSFMSRDGEGEISQLQIDEASTPLWTGPLVVLTDAASASASEALAGALQDYQRAVIVGGTSTYGKGSMQHTLTTQDYLTLRLTTNLFFTPSGRTPQKTGILSDIVLPQPKIIESIVMERDQPGVIEPIKIDSVMPDLEPAIPSIQEVVLKLRNRSQRRQLSWTPIENDTAFYSRNTQESLMVLSDLIEFLKK